MVSATHSALLAIDAGNTRIKWGIREGTAWCVTGAVATADSSRLAQAWSSAPPPRRAIASNVAGPAVQSGIEDACTRIGIALEVIRSPAEALGVVNGYADPAQL